LAAGAGPGTGAGPGGGTGPKLALAVDAAEADGPVIDVTRLRVALARLSRRLRRHQLAGLTPTQLAALATVGHSGPMRLGDLAAAEGIAPSTLTRLVTALEDSGYVRRCADPSDARASTLAITAHGQDALERIRTESTLALAASMQLLAPDQRAALADALPALEAPGSSGSGQAGAKGRLLRGDASARSEDLVLKESGQAMGQLVALPRDLGQLAFEFDDAADGLQGDAVVGHRDDLLDDADLVPRVAALAAGRPLRRDDLQLVDAAQEGLLDREQLRDLPDRVERRVLVVER
jgi:DNA-binding MarR family transcriptional regulator